MEGCVRAGMQVCRYACVRAGVLPTPSHLLSQVLPRVYCGGLPGCVKCISIFWAAYILWLAATFISYILYLMASG